MKTDARVRYTRRVIKESLLRLLEDRPVNRITVKEVCEAAQINRRHVLRALHGLLRRAEPDGKRPARRL